MNVLHVRRTYRELISGVGGAAVEDEEVIAVVHLDGVPRTRDVVGQAEVAYQLAVVGEEAQLLAHVARDEQVPVAGDC